MAQLKVYAGALNFVYGAHKAIVLPERVALAAVAVIRNGKVSEYALGDQMRQLARLFYFFNRIIISRKLLTHKAYPAHTGIDLDVSLDTGAQSLALSRQLTSVIEAVHRLTDVLSAQIPASVGGSIAEYQYRLGDICAPELESLIEIGNS